MDGLTCGSVASVTSIDISALTLLQVRFDPDNYSTDTSSFSTTIDNIWGMMNDNCIMKMSYDVAADTMKVTEVVDLDARDYRLYSVSPEHFDVTNRHFAIVSPVQCDPDVDHKDLEYVTSPSVDFYQFSDQTWSCRDLPATEKGAQAWTIPRETAPVVAPVY